MFRRWLQWWYSGGAHATDDDLLLLLDREVTGWRAARLERHLDRCWNCRVRKEKLEQAIHDYVAVRQVSAAEDSGDGMRLCREFDRRLAAEEEKEQPGQESMRWRVPAVAWIVLAIVVVGISGAQNATARAMLGMLVSAVATWTTQPVPQPPPGASLLPAPMVTTVVASKPVDLRTPEVLETAPMRPAPLEAPLPTEMDVRNAKIEVLYSLHRTEACLRYPLQMVGLPGGGLRVSGLVENDSQKDRLIASGRGRGWIHFDLETSAEAMERQREQTGNRVATVVGGSEPGSVSAPALQPLLESYFRARFRLEEAGPRMVRFSNEALDRAATVREHAWALRRLAESFPAEAASSVAMDQVHGWLLEEMLAEHRGEAQRGIAALREQLAELLPAMPPPAGVEAEASNWQAAVSLLLASAEAMEQAVRQGFAATVGGESGGESAIAILAQSFAPTMAHVQQLQALVERGLVSRASDSGKRKMHENDHVVP